MDKKPIALFLVWIVFLQVVAIELFATGFFLSRYELPDRSSCAEPPVKGNVTEGNDMCWVEKSFDKCVILIIDALRYDFASFDSTLPPDSVPNYRNKLPVLEKMLQEQPQNSLLFRFIVDAPTTTMQVLSLPFED